MKRTWLKYLAIIAMTLDHIAIMFLSNNIGIYFIFRFLGRITFPIMCFFLSEGFKYTHDKKKYLTRLIALAFISQFFFCLFNNKTLLTYKFFTELNTIYSLVLAFLSLLVLETKKFNLKIKIPLIIILLLSSSLTDYYFLGIILVCYFYYSKNHLLLPFIYLLYIATLIAPLLVHDTNHLTLIFNIVLFFGVYLTLPIFYLYKSSKGKTNTFTKYFFYIYYPLHLLILYLINLFVI